VTDSALPTSPAWVRKRDGSQVAFDADKISRALFAATEDLGKPDAFLARELADGVVHFLSVEVEGNLPTTEQIAELLVKVVRELGHPQLAQTFAAGARAKDTRRAARGQAPQSTDPELVLRFDSAKHLSEILRSCRRSYSLQTVFARDLAAAQSDGLLTLTGLDNPLELAAHTLQPSRPGDSLIAALAESRVLVGECVALDGPEYSLAPSAASPEMAAEQFVRDFLLGLGVTGLRAVVNLNAALPPSWADDLAAGPLFVDQRRSPDLARLAALNDAILGALVSHPIAPMRIDWHLSERDFTAETQHRLLAVARHALAGAPVAFVFDRPRSPVLLAEGIDRKHSAVLLTVGLHLPRLLEQPGVQNDPELFLRKLGSLARLALSAGTQKRDFLRRQGTDRPELLRGFLLGRARLVVAPVGLESVVQSLIGAGLCQGRSLDCARQIIERLKTVLSRDGSACRLDASLDAPIGALQEPERAFGVGFRPELAQVAGLTPWDSAAPIKAQLQAAGALHAAADTGTAAVLLPANAMLAADQAVEWLRWAWKHTAIARLHLVPAVTAQRQESLALEERVAETDT
jgi:hypothetical protein